MNDEYPDLMLDSINSPRAAAKVWAELQSFKWIDASKTKAPFRTPVLVLTEGGSYYVACWDCREEWLEYPNDDWEIRHVTHWMFLPEKPT